MSSSEDRRDLDIIRDNVKKRIAAGVEAGLHVLDAADKANVPREFVLSNLSSDPDIRLWWELSRSRVKLLDELLVENRLPEELKMEHLHDLNSAGLFKKVSYIAALADPSTPEGEKQLKWIYDKSIKLFPTQQNRQVQNVNVPSDPADIVIELDQVRREREEIQRRMLDAEKTVEGNIEEEESDRGPQERA